MAMLYAAYFDASGKREGYSVLRLAGALSTVKKWIRFEKQWNAIFHAEGVKVFHATDFAASQGEYLGWKGDRERHSRFPTQLIEVIRTNTNKLFSVSIELAAWNRIDSEYCFSERFYSPYALAGFSVIDQTLGWAKRKRVKPPEFIFEDGDDGWEGLLKLCEWDKITPIRLPREKVVPCQVGDMLAWKSRITATNSLKKVRAMPQTGYDEEMARSMEADLASVNRLKVRPGMFNLYAQRLY